MADPTPPAQTVPAPSTLAGATYEIIRQRLVANSATLRERMGKLDARRQDVFGRIESKLLQADRVTTAHNCMPRDMVPLGHGRFLFAFNVRFGLKKEMDLADVFAIYRRDEATGGFKEESLEPLQDKQFITDFKRLYNVYEKTTFRKFAVIGGNLYAKFGTGASLNDLDTVMIETPACSAISFNRNITSDSNSHACKTPDLITSTAHPKGCHRSSATSAAEFRKMRFLSGATTGLSA